MSKIFEYVSANYTWFLIGIIIIILAIIGSYADKTNFGQGKQKEIPKEPNKDRDYLSDPTHIDPVQAQIINENFKKYNKNSKMSSKVQTVNNANGIDIREDITDIKEDLDDIKNKLGNSRTITSNDDALENNNESFISDDLSKENKKSKKKHKAQDDRLDDFKSIVENEYRYDKNHKDVNEEFEKKYDELNQVVDEFLPKKDLIDGDLLDEIDNLSLDRTQKIDFDSIPDSDKDIVLPEIKKMDKEDEDIWKF